jgi:drug/metabolite transporter (DMT)-like permease
LILYVIIAAIFCQLVGSQLQVLGYAVIGLVIAVPIIQSSILLGVALLGYFLFGDSLSRKRKIAIAILIAAVSILGIGKAMTGESQPESTDVSAAYFLLVAIGTVIAGVAFAVYVVMMRSVIRQYWKDDNSARLSFSLRHWVGYDHIKKPGERHYAPFPVTLVMVIVLGIGMLIFGGILYGKEGVTGFYDVPHNAWYAIAISGVCNLVGFFFQIQGLRMTSAVQASLIAISQMLLLSLIGVLFFHEAINIIVMLGLGLTVYGIIMSARPESPNRSKAPE